MKNLKTHTVTIGDSLQKLARIYNVSDWRTIAELNELESPYIDSRFPIVADYGTKKVALVGTLLLIPNLSTTSTIPKFKSKDIEGVAYGKDLDLYGEEPIGMREKGYLREGNTDIQTVSGIANLAQQLMTRLSVKRGALLMHPDFGSDLDRYLGKLDSQENRNKILFEVEACIRSDARVQDVFDLQVLAENGVLMVSGKIVPIEPGQPFVLRHNIGIISE